MQFIHVDDMLLIVDKPAGLLAVPGRGPDKQDCLSGRVQEAFPDALIVHRLDMATSGLMVLARSRAAQRALGIAFAERRVCKRYLAVVDGLIKPLAKQDLVIDQPIALDWARRPLHVIDHARGKPSITRWSVIGLDHKLQRSRLQLRPLTGRSHQLRVHLQSIGHPIVGDRLYADDRVAAGADRLLLHATELGFVHPGNGTDCLYHSAAPF